MARTTLEQFEKQLAIAPPAPQDITVEEVRTKLRDTVLNLAENTSPIPNPKRVWNWIKAGSEWLTGIEGVAGTAAANITVLMGRIPGLEINSHLSTFDKVRLLGTHKLLSASDFGDEQRTSEANRLVFGGVKKLLTGDTSGARAAFISAHEARPEIVAFDKELGITNPINYLGWGLAAKLPGTAGKVLGSFERSYINAVNAGFDGIMKGLAVPGRAVLNRLPEVTSQTAMQEATKVTRRVLDYLGREMADQPGKVQQSVKLLPQFIRDAGDATIDVGLMHSPKASTITSAIPQLVDDVVKLAKLAPQTEPLPLVYADINDLTRGFLSGDLPLNAATEAIGKRITSATPSAAVLSRVRKTLVAAKQGVDEFVDTAFVGKSPQDVPNIVWREVYGRVEAERKLGIAAIRAEAAKTANFMEKRRRELVDAGYWGYDHIWARGAAKLFTPISRWSLQFLMYHPGNQLDEYVHATLGASGFISPDQALYSHIFTGKGYDLPVNILMPTKVEDLIDVGAAATAVGKHPLRKFVPDALRGMWEKGLNSTKLTASASAKLTPFDDNFSERLLSMSDVMGEALTTGAHQSSLWLHARQAAVEAHQRFGFGTTAKEVSALQILNRAGTGPIGEQFRDAAILLSNDTDRLAGLADIAAGTNVSARSMRQVIGAEVDLDPQMRNALRGKTDDWVSEALPTRTPPPKAGTVRLYRGETDPDITGEIIERKVTTKDDVTGRWFTDDRDEALHYGGDDTAKLFYVDVPEEIAEKLRDYGQQLIPPEYANKAKPLIDEHFISNNADRIRARIDADIDQAASIFEEAFITTRPEVVSATIKGLKQSLRDVVGSKTVIVDDIPMSDDAISAIKQLVNPEKPGQSIGLVDQALENLEPGLVAGQDDVLKSLNAYRDFVSGQHPRAERDVETPKLWKNFVEAVNSIRAQKVQHTVQIPALTGDAYDQALIKQVNHIMPILKVMNNLPMEYVNYIRAQTGSAKTLRPAREMVDEMDKWVKGMFGDGTNTGRLVKDLEETFAEIDKLFRQSTIPNKNKLPTAIWESSGGLPESVDIARKWTQEFANVWPRYVKKIRETPNVMGKASEFTFRMKAMAEIKRDMDVFITEYNDAIIKDVTKAYRLDPAETETIAELRKLIGQDANQAAYESVAVRLETARERLRANLHHSIERREALSLQQKETVKMLEDYKKAIDALPKASKDKLKQIDDYVTTTASERTRATMINYDQQNQIDFVMRHFVPYWTYSSRMWSRSALVTGLKPWVWTEFGAGGKYWDATDRGYIENILMETQINPLRASGISRFGRVFDNPEGWRPPPVASGGKLGNFLKGVRASEFAGIYSHPLIGGFLDALDGQKGSVAAYGAAPPLIESFLTGSLWAASKAGLSGTSTFYLDSLASEYQKSAIQQIIFTEHVRNPIQFHPERYEANSPDPRVREQARTERAKYDAEVKRRAEEASEKYLFIQTAAAQLSLTRIRTEEYQAVKDKVAAVDELIGGEPRKPGLAAVEQYLLGPNERKLRYRLIPNYREYVTVGASFYSNEREKAIQEQDIFWDSFNASREAKKVEQMQDDLLLQSIDPEDAKKMSPTAWQENLKNRSRELNGLLEGLKARFPNVPVGLEETLLNDKKIGLKRRVHPGDEILQELRNLDPNSDQFLDPITLQTDWRRYFNAYDDVLHSRGDALYGYMKSYLEDDFTQTVKEFRHGQEQYADYFDFNSMVEWYKGSRYHGIADELLKLRQYVIDNSTDIRLEYRAESDKGNPNALVLAQKRLSARVGPAQEAISKLRKLYQYEFRKTHAIPNAGSLSLDQWLSRYYGL